MNRTENWIGLKEFGSPGYATSIASTLTDDGFYLGGLFGNTVNFDPYKGNAPLTSTDGDDIYIARYRLTKRIWKEHDEDASPIACNEEKSTTTLFPNPTEDVLRINWSGFNNGEPIEVKIMNFFGNVIMTESLSTEKNSIDVTKLPGGYYVLQAKQSEELQTIRFTKK